MIQVVRVQSFQIGLVFRHGGFVRKLSTGTHWLWPNETVHIYNRGMLFEKPPVDLAILLAEPEVAFELDVIDVADNELVLQYENGQYQRLLNRGRWAFWKGVHQFTYVRVDLTQLAVPAEVDLASLLPQPLSAYVRSYTVEAHEKGVLFIDWTFSRVLDAGTYHWWKNNIPVHVLKVDMRQQQMEVSGQEILTRDKASLRVSFFVQYRVVDVMKALVDNKEYDRQLYVLMQLALREYIGNQTLDQLLETKSDLAEVVIRSSAGKAEAIGVELRGGGLRDIILPGDMRDILNQVLMAEKKAQANSIMRREETASTRSLLNTARLMEENEMLWKLKEMEYVEKIAEKVSSISLSGNGQLLDQLKGLFGTSKN
ncbi:slipin family protein [Spirosoma soli]